MRHPAARCDPAGCRVGEWIVKRLLLKIDDIVGKVSDWGMVVAGILIMIMGLLTTYGVGRRYIFNSPEPYSYELSIIFLVGCILLAIPGIQKDRRNLRVDFISNLLSPKWQGILFDIFTSVLALVFVSIVLWKSWGIFLASIRVSETSQSAWQEPLWPMKLLVPVTMFWLILVLISQLVHGVAHLIRGTTREDTRIQL
jgi:TRAP-type mannitol/chloroaromatic compound transport system permease small subunit